MEQVEILKIIQSPRNSKKLIPYLFFDNVLIPWENVLFHRSLESTAYILSTLHCYSAFHYTLRILRRADYLIGVALLNVEQTGLTHLQAVKEKISELINYRKGINAH
ncbi:4-hydroxyphenylacetate 3-hydroxylase C-terminal domain-containing protein [Neobacillus sp. C211]|uniref:4-hydroxyphenylacetate 3-hydroxylase C-terminal domain-containing protein n=1 Tax=unclassified Neobacillus TaxID=2675272 RepID=UPI003978C90B